MIRDDTIVQPKEATLEDLTVVHSDKYINSLKVMDQVVFVCFDV